MRGCIIPVWHRSSSSRQLTLRTQMCCNSSREDSRKHAKSQEVTWADPVATEISEPDVSSTCGEAHGSCSHLSDADGSRVSRPTPKRYAEAF